MNYKNIAKALRQSRPNHNHDMILQWAACVIQIADELSKNRIVSRYKFLVATGYYELNLKGL